MAMSESDVERLEEPTPPQESGEGPAAPTEPAQAQPADQPQAEQPAAEPVAPEPPAEPEPEPPAEPEPEPLSETRRMDAVIQAAAEALVHEAQAAVVVPASFETMVQEAQAAAAAPVLEPAAAAPEASEAPPAPEPDDGRRWYVVHCYSGYENKVRHNLEQRIDTMGMKDKIFDVVVPTEEEIEVKDGKRRTVERRVFPGYILVQMLLSEESWYVVRNTPGVTGFVGMGNEPTPLRPEEVAQIVKRMEAEAPRVKVTYKTGQKVRINDGPFNDFIGTVAEIDMERAKVRVMVSFFGRETPVELDFLQVEKA